MSDREFDVVVLGATGVTGRRVLPYLANRAGSTSARWAAAGRDIAKVERILAQEGVDKAETIRADVNDAKSMQEMASRARVVLNGVGPYSLYGRPVIEACVAAGTHYADLTGEIPFVREIIDDLHARAIETGAKVVQVCGFESVPSDIGVALAARTARERFGEDVTDVELLATLQRPPGMPRLSDGMSGGTSQSMAAVAARPDAAMVTDPAALVGDTAVAERVRQVSPISTRPRRAGRGAIVAPMLPAAFINPAVIHRTAWLDGQPPFRYHEGIVLDGHAATIPLRYAMAGAVSGVQAGLARLVHASQSLRERFAKGLTRVLPSSGFGPEPSRLEDWRWTMAITAATASGRSVRVDVEAEGHPGYLATSRMFGEAGLMLAEDAATPPGAGCLTPAVALGTDSVDRFAYARLWFRVGSGEGRPAED